MADCPKTPSQPANLTAVLTGGYDFKGIKSRTNCFQSLYPLATTRLSYAACPYTL